MKDEQQIALREAWAKAAETPLDPGERASIRGALQQTWLQKLLGLVLQEMEGNYLTVQNLNFAKPTAPVVASSFQGRSHGMVRVLNIILEESQHREDEENV